MRSEHHRLRNIITVVIIPATVLIPKWQHETAHYGEVMHSTHAARIAKGALRGSAYLIHLRAAPKSDDAGQRCSSSFSFSFHHQEEHMKTNNSHRFPRQEPLCECSVAMRPAVVGHLGLESDDRVNGNLINFVSCRRPLSGAPGLEPP